MKHGVRILAVVMVFAALDAAAVKVGEPLYVRSKDTKLFAKPSPKAKVLKTLQPGSEVVWEGLDSTNPLFHRVTVDDVHGFVRQEDLTPNKPQVERHDVPDSGRKRLVPLGVVLEPTIDRYRTRADLQLDAVEAINARLGTLDAIAAHANASGLQVAK